MAAMANRQAVESFGSSGIALSAAADPQQVTTAVLPSGDGSLIRYVAAAGPPGSGQQQLRLVHLVVDTSVAKSIREEGYLIAAQPPPTAPHSQSSGFDGLV